MEKTSMAELKENPYNTWNKSREYMQIYYENVTKRKRHGLEPLPMPVSTCLCCGRKFVYKESTPSRVFCKSCYNKKIKEIGG